MLSSLKYIFSSKEYEEIIFFPPYEIKFWILELQSFCFQSTKCAYSKVWIFCVHFLVWFTDCTSHRKRCWQGPICPLHIHGQWVWASNWSRIATEVCLVWNSNPWGQSSCEASSKKRKSQELSIFFLFPIIYIFIYG